MRYRVLIFCLVIFISESAVAQVQDRFKKNTEQPEEKEEPTETKEKTKKTKPAWMDKFLFGGNLGLQFGTNTSIYIAPSVGYRLTDNFIVGVGGVYAYNKFNIYDINNKLDTSLTFSVIGPKVFANYSPVDFLYIGTQFEYLKHNSVKVFDNSGYVRAFEEAWTPVLFIEAGFRQPIGSRGMLMLGIKYDVLYDASTSPYGAPWFPVVSILL